MTQLPIRLRIYIYAVIGAGAVALLPAIMALRTRAGMGAGSHDLLVSAIILAVAVATYLAPAAITARWSLVVHTALQAAAFIVLAPGLAGIVVGVSVLAGNVIRRRRWFNTGFNTAQAVLAVLSAGVLYHRVAPNGAVGWKPALGVVLGGATSFIVSSFIVDAVTAIRRLRSPLHGWWSGHRAVATSHMAMVAVGAASASAAARSPLLLVVAIAPVLVVRMLRSLEAGFEAHTASLAGAVADAVDENNPYLSGASRKLAALAGRLARAHGLPEEECRRVMLAARLHNIAAAMLPEYIQLGVGSLDEHQRAFWQIHPQRGGDIVADTLGLEAVADVLRYHHERLDGKGYPFGLHGSDIPLDARLLAVCEAWSALISDRGYRPALPLQNAWLVLRAGAGTQWDAAVIDTLGEIISADSGGRVVLDTNRPAEHPIAAVA